MGSIQVKNSSGTFSVYNSFVDKFIKEANPSYIKVYLYLLRHINSNNKITLSGMSKETGLIKSDIISALQYWNNAKVLAYNDDPDNIAIEILNPDSYNGFEQEGSYQSFEKNAVEKKNVYQPSSSVASSYKTNVVVKAIHDDQKLAHLFSIIQQMLNKNLSSNDYKTIYSFIDYLNLPEQVILILFEYCISINKTSMRYIETVAYSWYDSGITTVEEAEKYVKRKSEIQTVQSYYKQKFKITGRDFTDSEIKYLLSWVNDLKAEEELIISAYERTVMNTGKVSFKYMDAIIQSEAGTLQNKNTGNGSKFKNYPANYEISETEKNRIQKMLAEFEDGDK